MNDVISTLKSRRDDLALELGRIDKAIAILSNGSGASANGNTTRGRVAKPMSAAMKAKINQKSLSFTIGPPPVAPNCSTVAGVTWPGVKKLAASVALASRPKA